MSNNNQFNQVFQDLQEIYQKIDQFKCNLGLSCNLSENSTMLNSNSTLPMCNSIYNNSNTHPLLEQFPIVQDPTNSLTNIGNGMNINVNNYINNQVLGMYGNMYPNYCNYFDQINNNDPNLIMSNYQSYLKCEK